VCYLFFKLNKRVVLGNTACRLNGKNEYCKSTNRKVFSQTRGFLNVTKDALSREMLVTELLNARLPHSIQESLPNISPIASWISTLNNTQISTRFQSLNLWGKQRELFCIMCVTTKRCTSSTCTLVHSRSLIY